MQSLRQRILLPFLLIIVAAVLLLEIIMFQFYRYGFEASSSEKMSKMVERVSCTMSEYGESPLTLNQLAVKSMQQIKDISAVEIAFFDADNNLIFEKETKAINTFFLKSFIDKLPKKPNMMTPHHIYQTTHNGQIYFYYAAPLSIDGAEEVAYVGLSRYMSVYNLLTDRLLWVTFLFTIAFIGVTAILVKFITNKIVRPLNELENYATAVINKESYDYTPSQSVSEINLLGRCIQDMVCNVQRSEMQQRAFFENVSHELRTPVMAVQGYATGLADGVFEDDKKAIDAICRESNRLGKLVEQIMLLSRIDNKVYEQNKQRINLNDFIYEINDTLAAVLYQKKLEMNITCDNEIYLNVDKDLLLQVLHNPIINAIRYAHSRITVQVDSDKSVIEIWIKDDGDGFQEDIIPYVFERFHKEATGRVGLGMAIARAAVEMLEGTIIAYNQNGAVVYIKLLNGEYEMKCE